MDAVSYSLAAKQKQRIEKVIANPDSTSGIVTTPSVIATGETITIPTGRTAVLPNTTVNGTLVVDGEVFIPSGSSYTATNINVGGVGSRITGDFSNATISARTMFQTNILNGATQLGIVPNGTSTHSMLRHYSTYDANNTSTFDSAVSGALGQAYLSADKTGTGSYLPMTFWTSGAERMRIGTNGNVGIGVVPKARLDVYALGITGGLPATTGNAADPNVIARVSAGAVCMDFGVETNGHQWIQCRGLVDYTLKYDLHLQPNGGNVLVTGSGGLGYGAGAGGSVTQLTSKSTAVTLNKPSGRITMNSAALAAGASVDFIVYNSTFSSFDIVKLTGKSYSGRYRIEDTNNTTGSFTIRVTNTSGVTQSDPIDIDFAIIKGANA